MNLLAALLPLICFAALLRWDNFRESFLKAALATGLFVFALTETLSVFKLVAFLPVLSAWSLYLAALLFWRMRRHGSGARLLLPRTTWPQRVLLIFMAAIAVVTGVTAVVAAPNNFDSLTYHLPRIMHWIQNRSVAHYPTNIDRQLLMAPFSEYLMMHLRLLSGSDRLVNCVQWFSMVGSAVGVSLIARQLKGSASSQIVAAAIAMSLPMGLLQATSTQNDYALTFWLVCLTYFVLKAKERPDLSNALLVGAALGLAIFTKGTAYFIAGPIMLVYLWHLAGAGIRGAAAGAAVVAAAVFLINGAHLYRNYQTFQNPLTPGGGNDIICKRIDPGSVASCVARNVVSQLASGIESANPALLKLTRSVHRAIGVDLNDPQLTANEDFFVLPPLVQYHEDYAPNPWHMLLLLGAALALAFRRKKVPGEALLLALAMMLAFVALSMILKWTPFLSRYFIAVFVISAPVVALLLDGVRVRLVGETAAALLLLCAVPVLAQNQMRPLVGAKSVFSTDRMDQYFMARPQAKPYFSSLAAMAKAQPVRNVGIQSGDGNMLEYLLWVLMAEDGKPFRIEHVGVGNATKSIGLDDFRSYLPVSI